MLVIVRKLNLTIMRKKQPITILFLLLVFAFSCNDQEVIEQNNTVVPFDPNTTTTLPHDTSTPSYTFKLTNQAGIYANVKSTFANIKVDADLISVNNEGVKVADFSRLDNIPANLAFMKNIKVFDDEAGTMQAMTNEELRKSMIDQLNACQFSTAFKQIFIDFYDYIKNTMPTKSYASFDIKCNSFMERVVIGASASQYTELEKFAIVQVFAQLRQQVKYAYENPSATWNNAASAGGRTSGGCLPKTKDECKAVAEVAFTGGVMAGVSLGIKGIEAGAVATTAAGNPVAGGVIGGIIGFTIGFTSGALGSGSVKLMFECLWKKAAGLNVPLTTFVCSEKVYQAYTNSIPVGCEAGGSTVVTQQPYQDHVKRMLKSIFDIGVVPNAGKQKINVYVENDIKFVVSRL